MWIDLDFVVGLNGKTASTSITVAVDQTAPLVSIEAPVKDADTSSAKADIRGVVNDAIEGWIAMLSTAGSNEAQ